MSLAYERSPGSPGAADPEGFAHAQSAEGCL